jgi:UDP-3-O-[3-hydroxymyristoyl] glucosamine N-acyltransferase
VGGWDSGDEKLAAIGAGTRVGHREEERSVVLELEVLIGEFLAVNGFTTSSVEIGEVTTLDHKLLDHTVENGS